MRRILATDLGIWPVLQNMEKVSDSMLQSQAFRSNLANYILLYDQIVIPTGNLQILPVLRNIFGESIFDELIKSNIIVLARYNKWFSYIGNGGGLRFFESFSDPNSGKTPNLFHSYFAPLDEAIDTAIKTTTPPSSSDRASVLKNLLIDKILPVGNKIEMDSFRDETYKDILGSPYLRNFLSIRNEGRSLDALKGINANQVRIYSPHAIPEKGESPEIWSVLHAAFENFVLGLSTDIDVEEIAGDGNTLALIKAKGQRVGLDLEGKNAFSKIQEISGIPDIGELFSKNEFTPEQLLDLRESKHSQVFRDWFSSENPNETSQQIVERYVSSIGKPSIIEKLPIKTLRFGVTTGAGLLDPLTGAISSAVDSFLLSKWFPGKSPKLFIKHAKAVAIRSTAKSPRIQKPKMTGRDRNRPCSCGSGKKYKKCCGR
ncbi:SEC-C metal-binding domain-containing protein [Shewanella amazonensis]|uniref:SEC-C motif domain protein n=1 Tax=Shewanella amazonensis (strain ATCC BAA-1098 / SB2B) TaxID=326297 RepID=A1S636_SHEAM|nr:SEC-C metal-binding domain-containing protein [Shewanella amazonensis]ABL99842.1 hypothetical protein Sama_1635 [Shewanella amazonensis SB2B]